MNPFLQFKKVVFCIMSSKQKKVRALGLCSGGLDSTLAGLVLRKQGIDVEWIIIAGSVSVRVYLILSYKSF